MVCAQCCFQVFHAAESLRATTLGMQVAGKATFVSLFRHLRAECMTQLQVVGECARDNDLEVNPVREKKLTNIRTVNADEKVCAYLPA